MNNHKNINDLLVNFKPKVIRFAGNKFPTEMWNNSESNKSSHNISLPKNK